MSAFAQNVVKSSFLVALCLPLAAGNARADADDLPDHIRENWAKNFGRAIDKAEFEAAGRDPNTNCDETFYHMIDVRRCQEEKAKASAIALREAGKRLRDKLRRWDEDARYIRVAREKLAVSDRAFIRYRAEQCALDQSLAGMARGVVLEARMNICLAEENNRRAAQLQAYADETLSLEEVEEQSRQYCIKQQAKNPDLLEISGCKNVLEQMQSQQTPSLSDDALTAPDMNNSQETLP
jgi:uncharacterized protein YecT (DUF1311 family)